MSGLPFQKMHGAGNDYVFLNGLEHPLPQQLADLAVTMSDRHRGVGSDGLVALRPPDDPANNVHMQMWNADGSEGLMCGNAARCVALLLQQTAAGQERCRIETATRVVLAHTLNVQPDQSAGEFAVDLGTAVLGESIVCQKDEFPQLQRRSNLPQRLTIHCVSVGNPHAVIFLNEAAAAERSAPSNSAPQLTDALVHEFGRAIETWDRFPEGTNVEWVRWQDRQSLQVRVWERGSGETQACGSGACAVAWAAMQKGLCDKDAAVAVTLPGGTLHVRRLADDTLQLSGPATLSFAGTWPVP